MKIQQAIEAAIQQQDLDKDAMVEVMRTIMTGDATPAQIAGFLVALRMKGETVDEIAAAAIVMRELATAVDVEGEHLVDIVGTGGELDKLLQQYGINRLQGAHCYEFFVGKERFAQLHETEPGRFYVTDYLLQNFDLLIMQGMGLYKHPQLLPILFGNYRELVYLQQSQLKVAKSSHITK